MFYFLQNLEFIQVMGLVTLGGFYLGLLEYYSRNLNLSFQIIKSLRAQLKVSGSWASANKDGWILSELDDKKKLEMANPFYKIYKIVDTGFQELVIQPSIVSFDIDLLITLAEYNQMMSRIHDHIKLRDNLMLNYFEESLIIFKDSVEELENAKSHGLSPSYKNFLRRLRSRTNRFKLMGLSNQFFEHNKEIHYQLIGTWDTGGLKTLHHKLETGLEKKVREIKDNSIQYLTFFIMSFSLIIGFIYFMGYKLNNYFWLFDVIFGSIALLFIVKIILSIAVFKKLSRETT